MAVDPLFFSPRASEPPAPRRKPDTAADRSDFVLPEAPEKARSAPPRDDARQTAAAAASADAARDPAAEAPAAPTDAAVESGKDRSPGAAGDKAAAVGGKAAAGAGATGSKAALSAGLADPAQTAAAAPVQPTTVAGEAGALASLIAAAEQAVGASRPVAGAAVGGATQTDEKKKADREEAAASEAAADAVPAPAAQPPVVPDVSALLALGLPAAAGPAAGPDGTAGTPANEEEPAARGPLVSLPAVAGNPAPAAAALGQAAGEAAASGLPAAAAPGDKVAGRLAKAETSAAAAKVEGDVPPSSVAQAAVSSGESKPAEATQPAVALVDLSSLFGQGAARPGAAHPQPGITLPDAAAAAQQTPAQAALSVPSTPIHVVPIEIGMRALAGARQFDIRLDPAELGRIDVNLSISDKGEVSAKLVVDRVETLHLLQRDARTLERAFEQAGLKPSDSGVDISLRDDSGQAFRQQRQQDDAPQRQRRMRSGDEAEEVGGIAAVAAQGPRQIVRLGGVDLSI